MRAQGAAAAALAMATLGGMPLQEPVEVRPVAEVAAQSQVPAEVAIAARALVAEPVGARPVPVGGADLRRAARRIAPAL